MEDFLDEVEFVSWIDTESDSIGISSEFNGVVQNDERVIEFYIKNGFKPLSRRVGGYVVMGKSLL